MAADQPPQEWKNDKQLPPGHPWGPDDYAIDLGLDHYLAWTSQSEYEVRDGKKYAKEGYDKRGPIGATIIHRQPKSDTGWCVSGMTFDVPWLDEDFRKHPDGSPQPLWQVQQWNPLTTAPSLLCQSPHPISKPESERQPCGDHGFIRNGRWEQA